MVHGQRGDFSQDGYDQPDRPRHGDSRGRRNHSGYAAAHALPDGQRRPRRFFRRRSQLSLLGFGVTFAGMAAVAIAVMVGIGQITGGQAACAAELSLTAETGTVTGIATHYVLEGLPNCSYPTPPANGLFVALSPSEYDSAAACGGYMTVTGPSGSSVTVQVVDQCPECATGHIDLSEPAFAELAPLGAGLINVHYQYLADPPLPGPVTMEVKSGSSQYWLALLADNTGNPLASVQVETASGGWLSLARASYNYWIASSGAGSGPFTVRLTDIEGHMVTVRNIALDPGAVQSTGTYMYGAGSTTEPVPGPAPSSATAAASVSAAATASSASGRPAKPSRSPTARASGTGTPTGQRKRLPGSAIPRATMVPRPTPTASPTC
jgi:expansin (peptidoglycan-binding protein)